MKLQEKKHIDHPPSSCDSHLGEGEANSDVNIDLWS